MNRTTGVVIATGILLLLISFYIFFSLSQNSPASNSVANTPTPLLEQSSAPLTDTPPSVQEPVKAFRQGTWHQFKTLLFLAPENWRVVTSTGTDVVWMQPASQSDLSSFPRIQISFSRPLEDLEYVSVSERYSGYEDYYAAINANSRIASAYQAEYPNFVTTEPVIIQNRAVIVQEAGNEYTIFYQYQAEELQPEAEKIFIELLESLRYR
jgi:hypothetical protein